jgi:predicted nucleotidyltransferase
MIKDILNSKAKVGIIEFFCNHPNKNFQMIEVARHCDLSNSRTSECLRELAGLGLLESRKTGKGYEYKLNNSNYFSRLFTKLFEEERRLLTIIVDDFVKNLKRIPNIESVVLFGSTLTELKIGSDIDFLIVSNTRLNREMISKIETSIIDRYGFHISSTLMDVDEMKEKARKGEEFVINIIANGKVVLGKNLEEIIWSKR